MVKQSSGGTGFQPVQEFRTYRRNLPHWEQPGSFYFITFRTNKNFVLPEETRNIVIDSIKYHNGKKYALYACLIMPDHVHLILQSLEKDKDSYYSIAEIMHSIKSYSAKEIIKLLRDTGLKPGTLGTGETPVVPIPVPLTIWLDENFDRIIRNEKEYLEKMNYIVNNPLKKGLVEKPEDYKWLYVKGWIE